MFLKVFVSRPTIIELVFETAYACFEKYIKRLGLESCRLGADSYTLDAPLKGVIDLIKQCQGAIILGYPQYEFDAFISKGGSQQQRMSISIPTPWNHIETTLAFRQSIPVLIVAHEGVVGGVFDHGVTGQYVLMLDLSHQNWYKSKKFQGIFRDWKKRLI